MSTPLPPEPTPGQQPMSGPGPGLAVRRKADTASSVRRPSRFYPMMTFVAWLLSGAASVRWPASEFGKSFLVITGVFVVVLQNAQNRSQDFYNRNKGPEGKQ